MLSDWIVAQFEALGVPVWAFWTFILAAFLFWIINHANESEVDRKNILAGLRKRDNALIYTVLVDKMLGMLTRMIAPATAAQEPEPNGWIARLFWYLTPRAINTDHLNNLKTNSFSWPVADATLRLAIIYPLLLLMFQWGWTGHDTGLGDITFITEERRWWLRAAVLFPIVLFLTTAFVAAATQRSNWELAAAFLFFLVGAGAGIGAFTGTFIGAVTVVVALAGTVAFAGAFSGAVAITFAGAAAHTFLGTFASVAEGAFAGAAATAFAFAAGPVTFVVAVLVGWLCQKGFATRTYLGLVSFILLLQATLLAFLGPEISDGRRGFVFALGSLPVLNAIFDYLSYGLTLKLIKAGRDRRDVGIVGFALIDVACAFALLVGLASVVLVYLGLINLAAGQVLFDLPAIIADLRDPVARQSYTWLYLCMLTTLLPTLVHLVLFLLSAITWIPDRFKDLIAWLVEDDATGPLGTKLGACLAALIGAGYALLVAAGLWWIGQFMLHGLEPLGLFVLSCAETVALAFGLI